MAYLSFTLRLSQSAVASGIGDILAVFPFERLCRLSFDRKASESQTLGAGFD
jgi:hypothetical protein